ncbi:MAG: hypothetical protein ACI4HO_05995 [Ruminococcus sp.]
MKKVFRILISAVICCIVVCSGFFSAFSADNTYEVKDIGVTISLPDDMLTVTRDSKKTDPYFGKFKLDYSETMSDFTEGNIYLQSKKQDSSLTLTVTMTESQESEKIKNYNDLSESELNSIKNSYANDKTYKSCATAKYNGNTYVYLTISTKSGKKTVQAQQANTVVGGKYYSVTLQAAKGKKLTEDNKNLMEDILTSLTITESNFFNDNKEIIIFSGIILLAAIVIIVLFVLLIKHFKNPARKNKNLIHDLAHEYRISETTQIPRKRISTNTYHDRSFLDEFEPIGGRERKKKTSAKTKSQAVAVSEPVIEEVLPDDIVSVDELLGISTEDEKAEAVVNAVEDMSPVADVEIADEISAEVESQAQASEETPVVQGEENIEGGTDYFDHVPEEEELYSYSDVDTAVDDYSFAKSEAQRRRTRENQAQSKDTMPKALEIALKILKAIGKGLLTVLQTLWIVICFIVIHLKYFCINVYRLIKKSIIKRKRKKEEQERRQRAEERRRRQREAEMSRRRQNANRGENDLIKVHSNGERVRRPSQPVRNSSRPVSRQSSQRPRRY